MAGNFGKRQGVQHTSLHISIDFTVAHYRQGAHGHQQSLIPRNAPDVVVGMDFRGPLPLRRAFLLYLRHLKKGQKKVHFIILKKKN